MISDMRKHFQSPLYKAAVWVGIIGLAGIFSIPSLIKERNPNPWVIKVNDYEVGTKEFNWALADKQQWLSMIRSQYGEQADFLLQAFGIKADPISLAMEASIKEGLINDLALRMNIYLHANSVQDRLNDSGFIKYYLSGLVPPFAISSNGTINSTALQNFLARKGMKPVEFENQVEKIVERKIVMDIFFSGAYVPTFDTNTSYQNAHSQRAFDILTFSYEDQLAREKKQSLSQEEIERYYALKKGSPAYQIPEKRSGFIWSFNPHDYGIEISENEVDRYYQEHKAQLYVKTPKKIQIRRILIKGDSNDAQNKINSIYERVKSNPSLFEEEAHKLSEDISTASRGGLSEPFARGEKDLALERAAFLLRNDSDISSVIKTTEGFEIIQRVRIIQPEYMDFDKVSKSIETNLLRDKFLSQFATDCKNLRIKSQKDKNNVFSFIEEKNGSKRSVSSVPVDESCELKTLFNIRSIEGFDFCMDKDKGYIVQLTAVSKTYTADLSEVKDAVIDAIYNERARESLQKIAQEALAATSQTPDLNNVKKIYGGSLSSTPLLLPDEIGKNDLIKRFDINNDAFDLLQYVGLSRLVVNEQGAHIVKVSKQLDIEGINEGKKNELDRLTQQRKRLMSESFVASLYRNATIKTNESMINLQKNYSL